MEDYEFNVARRRVIRRYALRLTFVFNLLLFLMVMLLLAFDTTETPEDRIIGAAVLALTWGSMLLVHGALAFNLFRGLIDRAARREMEQYQLEEKPKRSRLELGEDGELNEVIDESGEVEQKSKNSAASG